MAVFALPSKVRLSEPNAPAYNIRSHSILSPMSRSLVHVLLSLLLLVSQQLSLGHGYTHWAEGGEALVQQAATDAAHTDDKDDDSGKLPKPGLHDLCGQCAASAQIAFALPATMRRFVPAALAYAVPAVPATPGICLLTACPFQSRAPPRA
jgi:hypothetical protein